MTVFRTATLRTFFFAFHAGAKELSVPRKEKSQIFDVEDKHTLFSFSGFFYCFYECGVKKRAPKIRIVFKNIKIEY